MAELPGTPHGTGFSLDKEQNANVHYDLSDQNGYCILAHGVQTSATRANVFQVGCIFINTTTGKVYQNSSLSSPSWNAIGDITAGEITLAEGNLLIGNASGVATALSAKTDGRILIGNGTTLVSVALSGDATIVNSGAITIANAAVTRTKMSAAAGSKTMLVPSSVDIATTSATTVYAMVPEAGTLSSVDFTSLAGLAANDTNYITFTITNKGQGGAGTTVMLAATDANTTKATGGTALTAKAKRALTLTGTGADLVVAQGDVLEITATATGTLAGAVTMPTYMLRFSGTT